MRAVSCEMRRAECANRSAEIDVTAYRCAIRSMRGALMVQISYERLEDLRALVRSHSGQSSTPGPENVQPDARSYDGPFDHAHQMPQLVLAPSSDHQ